VDFVFLGRELLFLMRFVRVVPILMNCVHLCQ